MTFALRHEDLHEAALDAEVPNRLPDLLAEAFGGRSAVLSWTQIDGSSDVLAYSDLSPEMMADYVGVFAPHDVWSIKAMSAPHANQMICDQDCLSSSEFKSTVFYNDFIRAHGEHIFHVLGGSQTSPFGAGLLGIYRNRGDEPFNGDDKTRLTEVMREVRGALMLRGRLAAAQRPASVQRAAWDATNLASLIVRADGRIAQHNAAAEAVLQRADGLRSVKNVLRAVSREQQSRLTRAIRLATAPTQPSGSALRVETPAGAEYLISVAPISRRSGPSLALVLFKDPLAPPDSLRGQLQDIWGLTPHEALVAAELAQGRAIADIARRRGVLESTVKTQLKAISGKMQCRGQAELIAKMFRLP